MSRMEGVGGGEHKIGKNGEKSYKTGEDVASSVKLLYLGILYRFISAEKIFVWFSYRFIGEKIFGQQNCIALFDFFLKNCVSVSL